MSEPRTGPGQDPSLVGFVGDDFTGSVDALLQYRRTGLDGVLLTGVEHLRAEAVAGRQVVGVATTARSLPTDAMAGELLPVLRALAALGPRLVQYKACSTADSSPDVGSLGRAIELAREVFGQHPAAVLFAQPDFGRYTVFGTHFAADTAPTGERLVYRLDRQPTMAHHPVTPMDEADLVAFLQRQTRLAVVGRHLTGYTGTGAEPGALLAGLDEPGEVVLDALDDAHLVWAGRAVLGQPQRPVFAIGSGGLSRGVGLALTGERTDLPATAAPSAGPALVVSGSCSARTWRQVQAAIAAGWVAVDALAGEAPAEQARAAFDAGRSVVAYSSAPGGPREDDGAVVAGRLAAVVRAVAAVGAPGRLVVAGGDTSGRVVRLLEVTGLEILATPWGNAALCRALGGVVDGVEVVLKGGQMGTDDLFERIRTGEPL